MAAGQEPSPRAVACRPRARPLRARPGGAPNGGRGRGTRASGATYLMHLIHSSFSSGVGAEIRYTVWFPSTTRPSASVLQALITWSLLSGM